MRIHKMLLQIFLMNCYFYKTFGQASQWVDAFQKTLCHNRWAQMDWQSILRPCRNNLQFGKNKYDNKQKTSSKWSHTLALHFKKTGEFSKVGIQTRTADGHNKVTGGDTWRIFIRGADNITPLVSDLNNGVYEAKFIAMNPGFYKAEIVLQSTLCQAFKDPPQDWLKREAETIISDEKEATLLWTPLRGGNISFKIEDSSIETKNSLKRSFLRWKDSCGSQYQCKFLWKGFGRWSNSSWFPYVEDDHSHNKNADERCDRQNNGVLKLTGDDTMGDLFHAIKNTSVCHDGLFKTCKGEEPGEQPNAKSFEKRKSKSFSTIPYLSTLKKLLDKKYMSKNSALLLSYGHPFVQNMAFKKYRTFIDRAVKILKEKYKGNAIWMTMSSSWKDSTNPRNHFKNHQRIRLFNAYATSAMCNAGLAVLDIYQMTESAPVAKRKEAVMKNIEALLVDYIKNEKIKNCDRSRFKGITESFTNSSLEYNKTDNNSSTAESTNIQTGAPTVSFTNTYQSTVSGNNLINNALIYQTTSGNSQVTDTTTSNPNLRMYDTTTGEFVTLQKSTYNTGNNVESNQRITKRNYIS